MGELYRLDFSSGRSYIGITRTTARMRYARHRRSAKNCAKGVVYSAWRKYGEPRLVVLAAVSNADLYETERRAIAIYGTRYPSGYNFTDGGDIPPSLTPEVAEKIRRALKGRKLSPERRARLSAVVTGRRHTDEARVNMSRAQKGRVMTLEHRAKLAAAKRGTVRSPEVRSKMSTSQRARREKEGCAPQRWRYP